MSRIEEAMNLSHKLALAAVGALVSVVVVRWQGAGRFVEEPAYTVELQDGAIEIRRYAACVRAETTVAGASSELAAREGFRRLAGYIFGGNRARGTIAMTAPVTQTAGGERIAMTAPVTQAGARGEWLVTFTMPRGRTLESLPAPNDGRVLLRALAPQRVAVLRYSGTSSAETYAAQERVLRDWLARRGLTPAGPSTSARYDPPSTLPMLRRNEVWIELEGEG
jgi:hypothetical protein